MKRLILVTVAAAGMSAAVAAQDPARAQQPQDPARAQQEQATAALKRELEVVAQARGGMVGVESRVTTGAPYSAEAVTESTQALADGNRIARKTVSRIYRDGEGRTRREEIDPETGALKSAVISDPVGHVSYSLDPGSRTALKSQVYVATPTGMGGGRGGRGAVGAVPTEGAGGAGGGRGRGGAGGVMVPVEVGEVAARATEERKAAEAKAAAEGGAVKPAAPVPATVVPTMKLPANGGQTTHEELGTQTIEGVLANGSRTTTVIAAGAIGNLQPIKIVSESWMSNDLKVLVLTRHSDPRSGETTYKLQGIVRAEPDRSLFSPPADYTVKDRLVRTPLIKQQ